MDVPLPALLHAAATWAMVGFIWTIQLLQYPQLGQVPGEGFVAFERAHQRRVMAVLALFAPLEIATAGWLFLDPGGASRALLFSGGLLLVAIWGSTGLVFVPLHGRLAQGFDAAAHRRLVRANWFRTLAWTARGALALVVLTQADG